ncbi:MAG TPA: phosphatidylglycerol lysyltransferase domain-containing protein [Vicinamibacterales bacterium]
MLHESSSAPDARLAVLRRYGRDAVAFQALESGALWWHDAPPPDGTGAAVAYCAAGRSWIAIGTPLVEESACARAVRRFARAAAARGRRAIFFGVEGLAPFDGFRHLLVGLQSELVPAEWPRTLRRSARLREQVRRARAKGVVVRSVRAEELAPAAPLRREVERLRQVWLGSRPMEPMAFLVSVEPFHAPEEHRYLIAERQGRAVHFLSAVPIYGRRGWLMEDMLRDPAAPNGTTELVIDRLMSEVDGDAPVTPGLTPLAGEIRWWLRLTRSASVALYDFEGLRRFRARLWPQCWRPVWLAWDRGPAPLVLLDVLRAFAGGKLLPFAARSLVKHPNGPPWLVGIPLVAWTILLFCLTIAGRSGLLGYTTAALGGWVAFDAVLAWGLLRVARRPRPRWLAALSASAAVDALASAWHLAAVGIGDTIWTAMLRMASTAGPIIGTLALVWALRRALLIARARRAASA